MKWQEENTPRGVFHNWHRRIRKARRNASADGTPCGVFVWGDEFGIAELGPGGKIRVNFGRGILRAVKGARFGRAAAECIWRFSLPE